MKWLANLVLFLAESSPHLKRFILLTSDFLCQLFAIWAAVAIRYEQPWPPVWATFFWIFPLQSATALLINEKLGMYSSITRFTGYESLPVVFRSSLYSLGVFHAMLLFWNQPGFPRSAPVIYSLICLLLTVSTRLAWRGVYSKIARPSRSKKRVLIYGAGSAGVQMAMALKMSMEFVPVCFVDDKPALQGRRASGIPIHSADRFEELVRAFSVDLVLLAMPKAPRSRWLEILAQLEPLPVEVKALPRFESFMGRDLTLQDIQDVQIEDLLGRDPVQPIESLLSSSIRGKSVMVTGAGGSIGSELCRQIANAGPSRLILFELNEFALYAIEAELRQAHGNSLEILPVLGSVCDKALALRALKSAGVQTVYHAAAYKHVPLVEQNPVAGVVNNLFGTKTMAEAAMEAGVATFVLISTDKAVRPTNVMGATKRLAELTLQAFAAQNSATRFTMVRFGNVLGSSGSVVPLFKRQIKEGGPVTVTHPEVVRYFMTIPEAVQLVLQAGSMGEGGDVFVLDMGEPVRIMDLARRMIRLSGLSVRDEKNPHGDVEIKITGLRPGEKMYEELLIGGDVVATIHPKIKRTSECYLPWKELKPFLERMERACQAFDFIGLKDLLLRLVDGYRPRGDIADPICRLPRQTNREAKVLPLTAV